MAQWTKDGFSSSSSSSSSSSNFGVYNGMAGHRVGAGYSAGTLPAYGHQHPVPPPRTKKRGKNASVLGRRSPVLPHISPIVEDEGPRSLTPPPDFVTDPDEEKLRLARPPLSIKGSRETFDGGATAISNTHHSDYEASRDGKTSLQLADLINMDDIYQQEPSPEPPSAALDATWPRGAVSPRLTPPLPEPPAALLDATWPRGAASPHLASPFPVGQTAPEERRHSSSATVSPCISPSAKKRPVPKPRKLIQSSSEPQLAGKTTPLHEPRNKKKLEELLESADDLAINARDLVGQTPLHCYVRRGNVDYVIALLSARNSVEINAQDSEGNTPLHMAVMEKRRHCINILLAFGASVTKTNRYRLSPIDLARGEVRDFLLQFVSKVNRQDLDAVEEMDAAVEHIDPFTLTNARLDSLLHPQKMAAFVGYWEDHLNQLSEGMASLTNFDETVAMDKQRREIRRWRETNPLHVRPGVRVLFLDGGGIRGLVELLILMEMERITGKKITQLFDWIVGTSIGAIIALSLIYGKSSSLKDVRSIFMKMKSKVFAGVLSLEKSTRSLEQLMKEEFPGDVRLCDKTDTKVMVCVVNKSSSRPTVQFFNNFMEDAPELTEVPLWYACRATSAAPMYFQSCGKYVDGGVMANNPSMAAWAEIQQYYMKRKEAPPHISIAVSVGTGIYPDKQLGDVDIFGKNFLKIKQTLANVKNLIDLLQNALSQSEETSRMFSMQCRQMKVPFFRFNPALIEVISPGETNDEKLVDMLLQTRLYLQEADTQEELVRMATLMKHLAQIQPSWREY